MESREASNSDVLRDLVDKIHELIDVLRQVPEDQYPTQLVATVLHLLDDVGMETQQKIRFLAQVIEGLTEGVDFHTRLSYIG